MNKIKPYLITFAVAFVAVAVYNKVKASFFTSLP